MPKRVGEFFMHHYTSQLDVIINQGSKGAYPIPVTTCVQHSLLMRSLELDTKKNRSNRLIAQVYQVCTTVVMCMRGS